MAQIPGPPAPASARAILHVDMDAFYASVEQLDNPALKGKPVMVGGTPQGRGVVAAASYEARAFGVHSAMSAAEAVRLCPDGVFLRPRMDRYVEISQLMFAILRGYSPLVEPLSIDEGFLDVSGCRRLFGAPEVIGRLIKERIAAELGLVASVGIAPNKFLAKLASELEKPDGFVVIRQEQAAELLADLPVGSLWGVGRVLGGRLRASGIRTVREFLSCPVKELIREFGDQVIQLRELALGHDTRPVIPSREARSVGNEMTFGSDIADSDQLGQILLQLCDQVARRLRAQGFVAGTLTLKARYPDFTTHTRTMTLATPTSSEVEIRRYARELLEEKLGRQGRALRLIGFTASGLQSAAAGQRELFVDPQKVRNKVIDRVMDNVNEALGVPLRRGMRHRVDD